MAMTNEELLALDGKIACGPTGEPVTIVGLKLADGLKQGSIEIKLLGKATGILANPADANDGENALPDPVECTYGVDIESPDKTIFYETLNRIFKIEPPLADVKGEDGVESTLLRFEPETENSVYDAIVGAKCHFRLKVKQNNPKFPPLVSATPVILRTREEISKGTIASKLAELRAKKEAEAEKKRKQEEELFS